MQTNKIPKDMIEAIECKYVALQAAIDDSGDEMVLIKRIIHTKDNRSIPDIQCITNVQRPVYVTREPHRKHNDKKEYEELSKLTEWKTTQTKMSVTLQKALGRSMPNPKTQLSQVCESPYVYFADLSTPTYIKAHFQRKYPNHLTHNSIAVLDIETDVVYGTNEPIMVSVTMGQKKIITIAKWWADKTAGLKERIPELYNHYLTDVPFNVVDKKTKEKSVVCRNLVEERGGDIEVIIEDNIAIGIRELMIKVHRWMPDFLVIWNMDYDIPKIMEVCDKYGVPHHEVWVDPDVPEKFRHVYYNRARSQRKTNSKTLTVAPYDQWHILECLAGFYVIDAMCTFKKIRVANGNESSYALDYILNKHLGIGKLRFEEVTETGLKWHIRMQKEYPIQYCIYCLFDCVSVELLDEKTEDLRSTLPGLIGFSEYQIFPSLPRRIVDNLTYFYLDRGLVAGCTGQYKDEEDDIDQDVISLTGWITTLPAHMIEDNGLCCIEEIPNLPTSFRTQAADSDISQAYPTGEIIMNVSKETTLFELKTIEGVSEEARRRAGINISGGRTNAIEVCTELLLFPEIDDVLTVFMQDMEEGLI